MKDESLRALAAADKLQKGARSSEKKTLRLLVDHQFNF